MGLWVRTIGRLSHLSCLLIHTDGKETKKNLRRLMALNQFTELPNWLEANRSCKHVHLVYFLCVHSEQFLRHFHQKLSKKCKKVDRIQSCATWDSLHSLGLSVWVFSISRRRCHSIMGTSCALWEAATLACNKLSSTLRTYELGASKLGKTVPESMASIFSGAMYDVSFLPAWCLYQ